MLIEHWDGGTWSVMKNPTLTGNPATTLHSVSCVSATRCVAVGDGNGSNGLAIKWSGTIWDAMSLPTPKGPLRRAHLTGVSCATGSDCFAVGYRGHLASLHSTIVHYDGTTWSIVDGGSLGGSAFSGVSCPATDFCLAVGHQSGTRTRPTTTMVERFDGSRWSIFASPNVVGFSDRLLGVTCASATSCVAVGNTGQELHPNRTLAEMWHKGAPFAISSTPTFTGSASTSLLGVACATSTSCFAVGTTSKTAGSSTALIEHLG